MLLMSTGVASAQSSYDAVAEQHILELANQARIKAGLPELKLDPGLTAAARQHSALMAASKQLSHDLPGEATLPVRLANAAKTSMTSEGENVAFAQSAEDSQQRFMDSPHHRANLLDAKFNLVGLGVVHEGRMVYVTQDFAHATLSITPTSH
jgi:uncharacterized protein YkwD